jgi:hypothetical protein
VVGGCYCKGACKRFDYAAQTSLKGATTTTFIKLTPVNGGGVDGPCAGCKPRPTPASFAMPPSEDKEGDFPLLCLFENGSKTDCEYCAAKAGTCCSFMLTLQAATMTVIDMTS